MKKYHPDLYLQNLEKDKTIKDNWIKSLRAVAPSSGASSQGEE
jgi:hypothetical protein